MCLAKGALGTTWIGRVGWEGMGTANDHIRCGAVALLVGWLAGQISTDFLSEELHTISQQICWDPPSKAKFYNQTLETRLYSSMIVASGEHSAKIS